MSILTDIQNELKVPKSQYNSFGKYYYRDLSDIEKAVKPLLKKYDVELHLDEEIIVVRDRVYVQVFATLKKDEKILNSTKGHAREDDTKKGMDGTQITGSASSYAAKYALNKMFLIDDTNDVDSEGYQNQTNQGNNQQKQTQQKQAKKENSKTAYIDENQYQVIVGLISELANVRNADFDTVFNWFLNKLQVKDVREILVTGYEIVCNGLKSQINKAKQGA